jgi:hypothetical protein
LGISTATVFRNKDIVSYFESLSADG